VYGDGKFRNTAAPTGTTARLTVSPVAGFPTNDYREWMNIAVSNWSGSAMAWAETAAIAAGTRHELGVLPATRYDIRVNGAWGAGLTSGTVRSDANGVLRFVYTGGYSTNRAFRVTPSLMFRAVTGQIRGLDLDFDAVTGLLYSVYWRASLATAPDWAYYTNVMGVGGGAHVAFTNALPQCFFQLRADP
jgi:hypothetical protein